MYVHAPIQFWHSISKKRICFKFHLTIFCVFQTVEVTYIFQTGRYLFIYILYFYFIFFSRNSLKLKIAIMNIKVLKHF